MSLLSPQTASRLSRDNVSYHLTQSPSALSRARALFIRNYSPQFGTSRLKKITNRPIRAYLDGLLEPPFHSLPNNALLRFISTSNSVIRVPPPCRGRADMMKEGKEKNLPSRHIVFQPSNRRRWKNQTTISPQTPIRAFAIFVAINTVKREVRERWYIVQFRPGVIDLNPRGGRGGGAAGAGSWRGSVGSTRQSLAVSHLDCPFSQIVCEWAE